MIRKSSYLCSQAVTTEEYENRCFVEHDSTNNNMPYRPLGYRKPSPSPGFRSPRNVVFHLHTESENSGRWDNDDQGLQMKGEKAPLSPVSEAQDEDDDDGLYMYDIRDAGVPAVPDGGYGWVIVFASFMCNLIVDGIAYTFGVFLPKIAESFGQGKGQVAWAGSLLCGVYLCVGPIVSALANKYGCRTVCIAGSFVGSAGFALSYLSPDLSTLMITYGVVGEWFTYFCKAMGQKALSATSKETYFMDSRDDFFDGLVYILTN
ncbi:Monocarboxylate transporter 9 [Orchesella cincta]|uniref:Monocarboxylate transporter 9 n=1 Tax=Orchesella cincta TaxID=48709 RepID=A0A1D2MKV7_ORCCI|nr:Monocarboxylate transporter 9 [Orchesella cincta]